MVKWAEIPTEKLSKKLRSVEVKGSEIFSHLKASNNFDIVFQPSNFEVPVSFNLKDLIAPLGRAGRVMYEEKNFSALGNFLNTYWTYKGEPSIEFDVLIGGDEKEDFDHETLRSRFVRKGSSSVSLSEFISRIPLDKIKDKLNRVVLGSDNDHIEIQFLSTSNRKEVKAGDYLDPGIFVKLNGNIEIASGVNRLVCLNGVTSRMNMWEANELNFFTDKDMFDKALGMADWLISKSNQRVSSVREISAALGDKYRKNLLDKFYKVWAEKIELKELMWYDVIQDLTQYVNRSLSNERYQILEIPSLISTFEKKACCPTCSAAVK